MPAELLKDLDNLRPIDHAVIARPHTPVYKMHRYFARRPWSVFHELIKHYSNPDSIILDPFCGGGVTVVEGLRLGRKVIGVDFNPLAAFVTRMEVVDVDLKQLEAAFEQVEEACRQKIDALYLTGCPKCGQQVAADWFEWSNVVECRECHCPVELHRAQRTGKNDEKIAGVSAGKFKCYHAKCSGEWRPAQCKRLDDLLVRVYLACPKCKHKGIFEARQADHKLASTIAGEAAKRIKQEQLWYPQVEMPDWWDLRRPYNAHIKQFSEWFTPRNLLANAILATHIRDLKLDEDLRGLLTLVFSASLRFTNRMVCRNEAWRGDKPLEWAGATYWLPEVHLEVNAWSGWRNRIRAVKAGKNYGVEEIGKKCKFAPAFDDLKADATGLIHTGSSTALPLPDASVDAIITDPPYGNNVLYAELSNFYWVWIGGILTGNGLMDDREEAVISKEHGKAMQQYRDLLYRVFKECHRVLKAGRWMVMTFHNREFKVWNAIHLAAHDAGFVLSEQDGMIYQPPITNYTQTIQTRRQGSMLGDFILSFQKVDRPPAFRAIEHAEIGRMIERLAAEAVLHHHGAPLSTIYMKLMPWLLNHNLLDEIGEKEVVPYLQRNFEEREGRWHVKGDPDQSLRKEMEQYSQQHYKTSLAELNYIPIEARLEYLIRRLLYRKGQATQDEVLNEVYSNLINSNAADYGEIQRVLSRIAELRDSTEGMTAGARKGTKKRKVWRLNEDVLREQLFAAVGVDLPSELQTATREESDHDLAIVRLIELAGLRGLKAHVGRSEQAKYADFRKLSSGLPARVAGMPAAARGIVEQIDVLWHNGGRGIVAAFEVERTTTITSGIDRFRNLLAAAPEADVELYIVVPKVRADEVRAKIGSPANRADGLHRRIGYVFLEDLRITARDASAIQWEEIVRRVNGGK